MRIFSARDDIFVFSAPGPYKYWKMKNDEQNQKPIPKGPYYHGTDRPGLSHILPATQTGISDLYSETDKNYSYATPNIDHAWEYAEDSGRGRPHVYEVEPLGGQESMEHDPLYNEQGYYREPREHDLRTNKGFRVVREVETPHHIRQHYTDQEWHDLGEQEKNHANPFRL